MERLAQQVQQIFAEDQEGEAQASLIQLCTIWKSPCAQKSESNI